MGIAGRVRPCRRSRSGSPHAPWKAGGRSETERSRLHHIPISKQEGDFPCFESTHSHPSHRVQCSEGLPTPMGIAGRVRPCRHRRSGSPHAPWKAGGRPQRNGTISSPPHMHEIIRIALSCSEPAHPLSYAQSAGL